MNIELKRPEKKYADVKVTEKDIVYFSLGIDTEDFILPSQRKDYRSDSRALALIEAIKSGKDLSGQDFTGVNLKGADISGGRFKGSNFSKACFYETKAQGCDFTQADFTDASIEKSDLTESVFKGSTFKRTFARDNDFTGAIVDDGAIRFFTALEKIILLIEQGELDIRELSKEDLLCLDIRRLDFTNIDLEGLDLSVFALDGINLSGTYIDPKQLMSRDGLNQYYIDVQKLKDKKRRELALEVLNDKKEQLLSFFKQEVEWNGNKKIETAVQNIKKPLKKIDMFTRPIEPINPIKIQEPTVILPKETEQKKAQPITIVSWAEKVARLDEEKENEPAVLKGDDKSQLTQTDEQKIITSIQDVEIFKTPKEEVQQGIKDGVIVAREAVSLHNNQEETLEQVTSLVKKNASLLGNEDEKIIKITRAAELIQQIQKEEEEEEQEKIKAKKETDETETTDSEETVIQRTYPKIDKKRGFFAIKIISGKPKPKKSKLKIKG